MTPAQDTNWLADISTLRQRSLTGRPTPVRGVSWPGTEDRRKRQLEAQRQQEQTERIKRRLAGSAAGPTISRLLHEMADVLDVQLHVYDREDPALRLGWTVTLGPSSSPSFGYFTVKRLFAGRELESSIACLGPAWRAPDDWLRYTEDDLDRLFEAEDIAIDSDAGVHRIPVRAANALQSLRAALRAAVQNPCQHPDSEHHKTTLFLIESGT